MNKIWMTVTIALAACGSPHQVHLGGNVHGLWDGADGVALRLTSDGVDTLATVTANGAFQLAPVLAPGTSFAVVVANDPFAHTCVVTNGNGVTTEDDVVLDVACRGPEVSIALVGHDEWVFDRSLEQQTFAASAFVDRAMLVIDAAPGIAAKLDGAPVTLGVPMPRTFAIGATSLSVAFTAGHLSKTFDIDVDRGGTAPSQRVYAKSSDGVAQHAFGSAMAVDGDTLVISAVPRLLQTGNYDEAPAVYVFVRHDGAWVQQARLAAPQFDSYKELGQRLAISGDTLVVADYDQCFVYTRTGEAWSAPQSLSVPADANNRMFNGGVAIAGDVIVAGAALETVAGLEHAGVAYVYRRAGAAWDLEAVLQPSNPRVWLSFGASVALSGDTIAIGAPGRGAFAEADNAAQAVYVFRRTGTAWAIEQVVQVPEAALASNVVSFGSSIALSGDTLAIGSPDDHAKSQGINGDERTTDPGPYPHAYGAAYVYTRDGHAWQRQAYLKSFNAKSSTAFGSTVALVGDLLAVGAPYDSGHPETGGVDATLLSSGAAFLFGRSGSTWSQLSYLKATTPDASDALGTSIALSADTLFVGAPAEDGPGTGVAAGGEHDNTAPDSGAFYIFR